MSNFHEILLHITEKYKLKLHKDEKEHNKFYKTLLLMHRYPVNTSEIGEVNDYVNMTEKMTLEKYLKKMIILLYKFTVNIYVIKMQMVIP